MNIAELRELIEYATPAPWSVVPPSGARVYPAVRGELRLVGSVHSEHNRPRANGAPRVQWRPGDPTGLVPADGIPDRMAVLRAFGNAIVPDVAAAFVGAVMEAVR